MPQTDTVSKLNTGWLTNLWNKICHEVNKTTALVVPVKITFSGDTFSYTYTGEDDASVIYFAILKKESALLQIGEEGYLERMTPPNVEPVLFRGLHNKDYVTLRLSSDMGLTVIESLREELKKDLDS